MEPAKGKTMLDHLVFDRVWNPSPILEKQEGTKAALLALGVVAIATAGIGVKFFEMQKQTAQITAISVALLATSAVTERDAPLAILGLAALTGTVVATVQAYRDGRFYVQLDLVKLLEFLYTLASKK